MSQEKHKVVSLSFFFFCRSLDWCQPYGPIVVSQAVTMTLTRSWWWLVSGWQPVTRSWTHGSTSCCDVPSSGRSTTSLKSRPVSREAHFARSAGKSTPFRTQRKTLLIRVKGRKEMASISFKGILCQLPAVSALNPLNIFIPIRFQCYKDPKWRQMGMEPPICLYVGKNEKRVLKYHWPANNDL